MIKAFPKAFLPAVLAASMALASCAAETDILGVDESEATSDVAAEQDNTEAVDEATDSDAASGAEGTDTDAAGDTSETTDDAADDTWETFTSTEGGYTIEFPGTPKIEPVVQAPSADGATVDIYNTIYDTPDVAYLVSYFDLNGGEIDLATSASAVATGSVGVPLTTLEDRTVGDVPCKFGSVVGTAQGVSASQNVLACATSERVYTLQVLGREGKVDSADVDRFLNSLEFN